MADNKTPQGKRPPLQLLPQPRQRPQAPPLAARPGWLFLTCVVVIVLALGTLLWWIGRDDSLATTLQRVARWLPAEQSLSAKEVTGSVKNGGHIGWLHGKARP